MVVDVTAPRNNPTNKVPKWWDLVTGLHQMPHLSSVFIYGLGEVVDIIKGPS